ncbi:hypothetical protein [Tunicatimonas pelagia]|uniref:hypothetical protein n=1 Tax=Tunicatimonas pelagia TaxID=931531 RepID=UPI0026660E18|nr:hypothetical protein [Tunicatimonas pelagia]WKN41387.1 hypothetical protein P0M28_20335 [Tunicatimonas pelagia]
MKTYHLIFFFISIALSCVGQESVLNAELQIENAVLAAPEDLRSEAMVYGFDGDGNLVTLREGSNDMVCIADDPSRKGFSASCYHRDLEPFMQRGRDLRKEGKSTQEIFDMRENEVKAGSLNMPADPTTLYVLSAPEGRYNAETGEVTEPDFRYVVYIPYATAASTGLPLSPEAPGMPWIMDPGTHRAHIMINPPKKEER